MERKFSSRESLLIWPVRPNSVIYIVWVCFVFAELSNIFQIAVKKTGQKKKITK